MGQEVTAQLPHLSVNMLTTKLTSIFIQSNYKIVAPYRPIINLAKTLECFGKREDFSNNSRYKFRFSIYNDEPLNGTAKLINVELARRNAGHTYIGLERTDSQTGQVTTKVIGFYPQSSWQSLAGWNVQGTWGDDGNTSYDEVIHIDTNAESFYNAIDKLGSPAAGWYLQHTRRHWRLFRTKLCLYG